MSFSRFKDAQKVMVSGLGACTPLGITLTETWTHLLQGYVASRRHEFSDCPTLPVKIAATIPRMDDEQTVTSLNPKNNNPPNMTIFHHLDWMHTSETYYNAHVIQYSLSAAQQAIESAKLDQYLQIIGKPDTKPSNDFILDTSRVAVCMASGLGGMDVMQSDIIKLHTTSHKKLSPYSIPNMLPNTSAGAICMRYGLHGPNLSCSTACAASAHAINEGFMLITLGLCDVAVVGGCDSSVTSIGMAGFNRCKAVTTKYNDMPGQASRPFDKQRSGFVMGEGAGCLILESEEHAMKRGFNEFYGQLVGISATSDAYHVTSVEPSGRYVKQCMLNALSMAEVITDDMNIMDKLGYVNAHATSTPAGDSTELKAILEILDGNYTKKTGGKIMISSTKGSTGHLLGGSGAVEACFSLLTLKNRMVGPTKNLEETDEEIPDFISLVPNEACELNDGCEYALSNSFGFGGTNASLLFKAA